MRHEVACGVRRRRGTTRPQVRRRLGARRPGHPQAVPAVPVLRRDAAALPCHHRHLRQPASCVPPEEDEEPE
ncbi:hypothetical protein D7X12_29960 [Corallococcus sicarius]|uniref:Uncharacterized protein n=1 Tax=Corallococcus sicarius TaxID=2316726 RepID=A0A3A8MZ81_9BACT|nr:hypothetical protein D7X12_29960 [Corallococcus sicarius]